MNKDFLFFHKPFISEEEVNEIVDTVRSGWLSMGPKTIRFEEAFNSYIGCKKSIAVSSWTAAGHLTLEAYGIRPGDEVIVPTMTFPATAEIVCYFAAKPVIVDVDEDTLNISLKEIERAITPKTKAIIPVHYGGQPCDMDEIHDIANKHNIKVIEDAAHSLPATYKGKKVGTISDVTCFSFYATKTLSTGEGGMICTNDEEIAERCSIMRLHGINRDAWKRYTESGSWYYEVVAPGYKYNFTDLQASLGLPQLKKVDLMWQSRRDIAARYTQALKDNEFLTLHTVKGDRESSWHLFPIRLKLERLKINRAQLIDEMRKLNIGAGVHFMPVHQHVYYTQTYKLDDKDYPVASSVFPKLVSLPIYPGMKEEHVDRVINVLVDLLTKYKK
ncbi:MAG: UDP-4-amino-4,6-dideoxy-N-acetyl-beta-L-altrosamine transaminase [Ignavibacteria bacterium GWA2_35_9]|nr:MAG: UDP-4-amino-4,6-dideoxy-N-acetyl-beta-L-altrosamine transaminase [Ignavibacteria bacterium GWA2_35_9]OGU48536.1 MAG: UDP-4-amino-4,6-dideoxy-N-acetyl-beta-L-altrosamine transaminase [Ignavibacteria bacterium GWC2_36_12]